MSLSIDDLVDEDFKTYAQLKQINENFLNKDEILILLRQTSKEGWSKSEICGLRRWIQTTTDQRDDVRAVVSTVGLQWPKETNDSFHFTPFLNVDCTNGDEEAEIIEKGFRELKSSPWAGVLTSVKADDLAILIYPGGLPQFDFFGSFNAQFVNEIRASFQSNFEAQHPQIKTFWAGDGIFQYYLREGYEKTMGLNLLMSVLALFFFWWLLGTISSGLIFLTTVTWTSVFVYSGMAYFGHPIDVLSSALSLMIFVSAIEDFVFLSYLMRTKSWRCSFRKILLPSFFTSATTAIGFGSLAFADLGIIRRFGLWAGAGSLIEWGVLFLVIPALCQKWPRLRCWIVKSHLKNLSFDISPLKNDNFQIKKWASLLVFPIGIWGLSSLNISDSPERIFSTSHPVRQALNKIEETRGFRAQMSLVFADSDEKVFNQKVMNEIKKNLLVSQIEDLYSIQNYLNTNLSGPMRSYLESLISQNAVGHRLGPQNSLMRAIIYVKALEIKDIQALEMQIAKLCPAKQCWLAGTVVSYGELGTRVMTTLYKSLLVSFVLVGLILFWLCMAVEPKSFIPLMISSTWGTFALLSIFYLFNIPVFYVTSMIASILVGIAGDNAIQFLLLKKHRQSLSQSLRQMESASLAVCIAMILSSSVFFLGYFAPMKNLGAMLVAGFFLVWVGDVIVLKFLLREEKT